MSALLADFIDEHELDRLLAFIFALPPPENAILLRNDILRAFHAYLAETGEATPLRDSWRFLRRVQEILCLEEERLIVYRQRKASCRILRVRQDGGALPPMNVPEFLAIKERLVDPGASGRQRTMELNLAPFYDYGPHLRDPQTIGQGITFLNRHMSGNLANQPGKWHRSLYEFLKLHHLHGTQLLLDGSLVRSPEELEEALDNAVDFLERCDEPVEIDQVRARLRRYGLLPGWGRTLPRMLETINLLQDTFEQPNEAALEEFLARIPMVSRVVLISPHGWFGQEKVLGRPDTGGQVVYVLDQAKALEANLRADLFDSGFEVKPEILIVTRLIPQNEGTTSDQPLEKVRGTENVWILRVPFRDADDQVVPHWLSRFRLWPYLDRFAQDAECAIREKLGGRPDLIVGNYSDGNLVATRLSKSMGVIQANIAHALEKSKYLFSDLHWQQFEPEYHFSLQFMADLIAMNLANFIITSTSQEITGTDESIGQYESYQFFTMPGLVNVVSGINLFHPRFNVIPPGVSQEVFFPYSRKRQRPARRTMALARLLFEEESDKVVGRLDHPERPPIFTIARLDRIKNLTGLVEAYGKNPALQEAANLVLVASVVDPARSLDVEEREEIHRMHALIEEYGLQGRLRWIGTLLSKADTGEAYRIMADRRGVFVQPALFEAFGLTILEAMHSGLPVFATQFGGPLEIIEHEKSGFLINPTDQTAMAARLEEFFRRCASDGKYWQGFSRRGQERARSHFTWELHCRRLTRLTKVYGFWRYSISQQAKGPLAQYCELLYHLYFRERAKRMLSEGGG